MESGCRIGHLNLFRRLDVLAMERASTIGNLNWFTGSALPFRQSGDSAVLHMKEHSAITSRHYFDVQAPLSVGSFTTIAGVRSTFLTHAIDLGVSKQRARPIAIGDYCFLSSNIIVLSGVNIAARTVVAAGALVAKSLNDPLTLYAGVPARPVKKLGEDMGYFNRKKGYVE